VYVGQLGVDLWQIVFGGFKVRMDGELGMVLLGPVAMPSSMSTLSVSLTSSMLIVCSIFICK